MGRPIRQFATEKGAPIQTRGREFGRRCHWPCIDIVGKTLQVVDHLTSVPHTGRYFHYKYATRSHYFQAFPLEDSTSFVEVIVSVFQASGPSILSSGFIAHVLSIIAVHGSVDAVLAFRPLDRFLLWTRASRKVKSSLQRFKLPLEIWLVNRTFSMNKHLLTFSASTSVSKHCSAPLHIMPIFSSLAFYR